MRGVTVIFFMEKNVHGAWVVYGIHGVKQYYGYTKSEARKLYINSGIELYNNGESRNI